GLQQAVPQQYIVQVVASSGTTGEPLYAGLTRRDQESWNDAIANTLWTAGIRPDDVVAHVVDLPAVATGWPDADGLRRLGATVARRGGRRRDRVLAGLPRLGAPAAVALTSTAAELAEEAIASGATRSLGIRKLLAGGEPGLDRPEVRARLAEGWGVAHVR